MVVIQSKWQPDQKKTKKQEGVPLLRSLKSFECGKPETPAETGKNTAYLWMYVCVCVVMVDGG